MRLSSKSTTELPLRPRLVLRVAFAGSQKLPENATFSLRAVLVKAFETIGYQLAAIAPGVPVRAGQEPGVAAFYAPQCPLLRLVTGLCEGADTEAAHALDEVHIAPDGGMASDEETAHTDALPCLETELAAVLPFDLRTYRSSRTPDFRPEFDRQARRCRYILTLDGRYEKPAPDTPLARNRRAAGYRAQSAVLLRHGDLLVAAANPDDPGEAGGTLATVRHALDFGLPVVFVHTVTGDVWLINPEDDLHAALSTPADQAWSSLLEQLVWRIVANPDTNLDTSSSSATGHQPAEAGLERLLCEYFDESQTPPCKRTRDGSSRRQFSIRERFWTWFEKRLRTGRSPTSDPSLPPYQRWRDRATSLNYHYAGLYRGAFLLNYLLAVIAVVLAALSLVLLVSKSDAPWLEPVLLGLGALKLCIVIFIYRNTHRANHEQWNERAVDYRYLAERLRALYYLPRVGGYQPPAAASLQYASRVVRQSAVDWLFDAITRAVSPAEFAREETITVAGGQTYQARLMRLDLLDLREAVTAVRDDWIAEQAVYHKRTADTMGRLCTWTERLGSGMGLTVIGLVVADILVLIAYRWHLLPHDLAYTLHTGTPWLLFGAAILPAAVAAFNGIRFQSECRRLVDRSVVMRVMLVGRDLHAPGGRWQNADCLLHRLAAAEADPVNNPGAWSLHALRLTEAVAKDFVQEVAEWSVLYAKELSDPG
jgi:hypothetical protein